MFVGHLGVGLALKKVEPELNLGILFFASLYLDVLLGILVLAGIEQIVIPENYSQLHYLNFIFPYSHSLLAAILWSLAMFFVAYMGNSGGTPSKIKKSFVIGGAVLLHWICDLLEHPPQLPLAGGDSHLLGLGLWNKLGVALTIEVILVVVGTMLYLGVARKIGRTGRWGIVMIMFLITTIAVVGQLNVSQTPEETAVGLSMIIQAVIVCGMATWIDRNRENDVQ